MYLLAIGVIVLLLLLYFNMVTKENFGLIKDTFDLVKKPRANINKLNRKLRLKRDQVKKERIKPLHNKMKKIFM